MRNKYFAIIGEKPIASTAASANAISVKYSVRWNLDC